MRHQGQLLVNDGDPLIACLANGACTGVSGYSMIKDQELAVIVHGIDITHAKTMVDALRTSVPGWVIEDVTMMSPDAHRRAVSLHGWGHHAVSHLKWNAGRVVEIAYPSMEVNAAA